MKDLIAAAQRSGLKSKGDIASYVARDPSVRGIARHTDGQLDMAALGLLRRYGTHLFVADHQAARPAAVAILASGSYPRPSVSARPTADVLAAGRKTQPVHLVFYLGEAQAPLC